MSRDGNRITFSRVDGRDTAVYVYDVAGTGSARRVAFGARDRFPIWSADSQSVIFQSDREGDAGLYRQRQDGSGSPDRLTTATKGTTHVPLSASPDGSALLFTEARGDGWTLMNHTFKDGTSVPYGNVTGSFVYGGLPSRLSTSSRTRPPGQRIRSRPRGKVAIRRSGPPTAASCSSLLARDGRSMRSRSRPLRRFLSAPATLSPARSSTSRRRSAGRSTSPALACDFSA